MNENKRVPTNKEIVDYANTILKGEEFDINAFLSEIESLNDDAITIRRFKGAREIVKTIRDKITQIKEQSLE